MKKLKKSEGLYAYCQRTSNYYVSDPIYAIKQLLKLAKRTNKQAQKEFKKN